MRPTLGVVVPARDEAGRIAACLDALAGQRRVDPAQLIVVLVLDGCSDRTQAVAQAQAARSGLRLRLVDGPARGVGPARALGMRVARASIDADDPHALLASTDADTEVADDWLATQRDAVRGGARAVGGVIALDASEARALPAGLVQARTDRVPARLAVVRTHAPEAEHHQFSGASLALTPCAYDQVGGMPDPPALEDEALERALRAHGIPIAYRRSVRVTTSARLGGRVPHAGLAHTLRSLRTEALEPTLAA